MVTIVVPVYNEEESLPYFYKELTASLKSLGDKWEVVFVDDGSKDSSFSILKKIAAKDTNVRLFSLRRNQGKSEALMVGFQKASGEYVVTLDADLQDKPDQIQKLLDKAKEGFDLVAGWRKDRQDSRQKIISSRLFNYIVGKLWGLKLHDYNCGLKAYRQEAAKSLQVYGGLHRFVPLILYQQGFSVCEVPVVHSKRAYGKSKYGFSKLWNDFPDIFTMIFLSKYSKRPLHFFGTIGILMLCVGFLSLFYLAVIHAYGQSITERPLFFFGIILLLSGFQVFLTGFLADLIINVSERAKTDFQLKYASD